VLPHSLTLFVAASLALTLTPGPAVLYIVTRSVAQGRAAGVVSGLGIATGGLLHVVAAVAGLSALVAASALAFSTLKYAGAAYLIWLGVRKLARPPAGDLVRPVEPEPLPRVFGQGVVVNVLNPKTALFFLAFLPQFVVPADAHVTRQLALLGGLFVALAFCTDMFYAVIASGASGWLRRSRGFATAERYVSGSVYLGLGLTTALAGPRTSLPTNP